MPTSCLIPRAVRTAVYKRDGQICRYCDVEVYRDGDARLRKRRFRERLATLDHVIPVKQRGPSSVENLVVACKQCNERKGRLQS